MTKSYKTLVFDAKIRNEIISISLKVPISYGEYAITNMYRPKDLFQAPFPFATLEDGESLQEFQQDCANIIEVTKRFPTVTAEEYFSGLKNVVKFHIRRCGRLILGDLMIYIDCFSHIMRALGESEKTVKFFYPIALAEIVLECKDYIKVQLYSQLVPIENSPVWDRVFDYVEHIKEDDSTL